MKLPLDMDDELFLQILMKASTATSVENKKSLTQPNAFDKGQNQARLGSCSNIKILQKNLAALISKNMPLHSGK